MAVSGRQKRSPCSSPSEAASLYRLPPSSLSPLLLLLLPCTPPFVVGPSPWPSAGSLGSSCSISAQRGGCKHGLNMECQKTAYPPSALQLNNQRPLRPSSQRVHSSSHPGPWGLPCTTLGE